MLRKILDGQVTMTPLPDGSGVAREGQVSYGKVLEGGKVFEGTVPTSYAGSPESMTPVTEIHTHRTKDPGTSKSNGRLDGRRLVMGCAMSETSKTGCFAIDNLPGT